LERLLEKVRKLLTLGSYGRVILVKDKRTGSLRAMKSLKKIMFENDDKKHLLEEVKLLMELDHPNIMKVFSLYEEEKFYRIITEY